MRKGQGRYEIAGVGALRLGDRGSESYLSEEPRRELEDWLGARATVTVAEVREHIAGRYGVVYQAKQSDYEVLAAGGRSYPRSAKGNPKRAEAQVVARREEINKTWRRTGTRVSRESGLS